MAGAPVKRERHARWDKMIAQPAFWDSVFELMSEGQSLTSVCQKKQIGYSYVMRRLHNDEELKLRYAAARQARAQSHVEQIEQHLDDVIDGAMDPHVGRVVIDGRKWLASRMDPQLWGDKQQHSVQVLDVTRMHLDALKIINQGTTITIENTDTADRVEERSIPASATATLPTEEKTRSKSST